MEGFDDPTDAQFDKASNMGIDLPDGCTASEAGQLIALMKQVQAKVKERKALHRKQNPKKKKRGLVGRVVHLVFWVIVILVVIAFVASKY